MPAASAPPRNHDQDPDPRGTPAPTIAFPDNPVLVATTRGEVIESFHRGAAIALSADGIPRLVWGDVERPVFARSALKPLQAMALLEALPDAPDLTPERVALHTASHSGWPMHVDRVRRWLSDMGLSEADLECGAEDWPFDPAAARALAAAGGTPGPAHHNCSGQHAGFLRLARAMGAPTAGYLHRDHLVQQAVTAVLSDLTDVDAAAAPSGIEGCGIPSPALPLWAVALGLARLADPAELSPARATAAVRLRSAMAAHPDLVAGPDRFDTCVMTATAGGVLIKVGAEGTMAAILPRLGLGAVVRMDDGAARAAPVAMGLVLERLGALTEGERDALLPVLQPDVRNAAGRTVGRVLPVLPPDPDEDEEDEEDERIDPWDEGWDDDPEDDAPEPADTPADSGR